MNPVEILVPLLEGKKPDRVLRYIERDLIRKGYRHFSPSWVEIKEGDSWFTKFSFKIQEPQPGLKKAIEFALNQALKEEQR